MNSSKNVKKPKGAKGKKKPQGQSKQLAAIQQQQRQQAQQQREPSEAGCSDQSSSVTVHSNVDSDCESSREYKPGGYHPVQLGELYNHRYVVLSKLGWGHFSTVWLVHDCVTGQQAAMKIVKSAYNYFVAAEDEIKILLKVAENDPDNKSHCVQLLDQFWHEGPNGQHVCMVMEILGDNMLTLLKLTDYRPLPFKVIKHIMRHLLESIDYLHRQCNVIHTDIKPENIVFKRPILERVFQLDLSNVLGPRQLQDYVLNSQLHPSLDTHNNHHHDHDHHDNHQHYYDQHEHGGYGTPKGDGNGAGYDDAHQQQQYNGGAERAHGGRGEADSWGGQGANVPLTKNQKKRAKKKKKKAAEKAAAIQLSQGQQKEGGMGGQLDEHEGGVAQDSGGDVRGSCNERDSQGQAVHSQPGICQGEGNKCNGRCSVGDSGLRQSPGGQCHDERSPQLQTFDNQIGSQHSGHGVHTEQGQSSGEPVEHGDGSPHECGGYAGDDGHTDQQEHVVQSRQRAKSEAAYDNTGSKYCSPQEVSTEYVSVESDAPRQHVHATQHPVESEHWNMLPYETTWPDLLHVHSQAVSSDEWDKVEVKLIDFGNACWIDKHFTDDIQTRHYRAPEVILGQGYEQSADMWSVGCVMYELACGEVMFMPSASDIVSKTEDHLSLMEYMLGKMSKKYATTGKYARDYFNRQGELRHLKYKCTRPIWRFLHRDCGYPVEKAEVLENFIRPMLEYNPKTRATAAQMLQHPWLNSDDDFDLNEYLHEQQEQHQALAQVEALHAQQLAHQQYGSRGEPCGVYNEHGGAPLRAQSDPGIFRSPVMDGEYYEDGEEVESNVEEDVGGGQSGGQGLFSMQLPVHHHQQGYRNIRTSFTSSQQDVDVGNYVEEKLHDLSLNEQQNA